VPNKLTADARQRLEELGCDPLEGMATIAMDPKAPEELRGRMFAELAQYVYPKRKAIDHTVTGGSAINVNLSATETLISRINSIASRAAEAGSAERPE
jgi:hypothetical protein